MVRAALEEHAGERGREVASPGGLQARPGSGAPIDTEGLEARGIAWSLGARKTAAALGGAEADASGMRIGSAIDWGSANASH